VHIKFTSSHGLAVYFFVPTGNFKIVCASSCYHGGNSSLLQFCGYDMT
jgi:hypothetical protein